MLKASIIILAAGSSTRLGRPKQFVKYKGKTLIQLIVNEAISSKLGDVSVILGANADLVRKNLHDMDCSTMVNTEWSSGIGSSISFGVRKLDKNSLDGIFILLGDQPFFQHHILQDMASKIKVGQPQIIICKYAEGNGPPVYFSNHFFEVLSKLEGDQGAKLLIDKFESSIEYVDFPKGNIDIDTEEDLSYLK